MSEAKLSPGRQRGRNRALGWGLVVVLLLLLYGPIFLALVRQWWTDPDYSHGFLVPLAAFYFAWRKRRTLSRLPVQPSGWGLVGIVGAQAVLLVGYLGSEYFLQRFSFVLLLASGVLFFYGWAYLRNLAFPLAFLVLMIPLPAIVYTTVTGPLQLVASQWAESFLRVCQIPVYREGNLLILAHQTLNVTEACSGIRSLVSLLTLGLIVAYVQPLALGFRGLVVLSVLPITLLTNSFRVAGTGLLGQWGGQAAAEGFFHGFSGWLIFLVAFGLLFAETLVFGKCRRWWNKSEGEK